MARFKIPFIGEHDLKTFAGPLLIILVLAMMVVPLPPFMLDILFTFNITLSLIVMMASLYTARVLDFASFPSLLLLTTLLRLSLNVASARIILLRGYTGPYAAGHVIESFGEFVVGGSYVVGFVVFAIFIIINFVVITKGATRIAEVAARFTLDAMPGKQMAIDADLNAGLLGEEEARNRRHEISVEADFFGAMDGASKFVRGDAIAAILILTINIIGGLIVGVAQHHMSLSAAATRYTLLTVGDGLVSQIPALIISTSAGVVVSRVSREDIDLGRQILTQLLERPIVIAIAAGIMITLGLIPGMPHVAFLAIGSIIGGVAWMRYRKAQTPEPEEAPPPPSPDAQDVTWEDIEPVDPLGLEVGYRLIPLVDAQQGGELLARIRATRRKFAKDLGFLIPAVHIRDNLELRPGGYRILVKDVEVARGEVFPDLLLAINPGEVSGEVPGTATQDPAFGLPAVWINSSDRERAQAAGYTVVDATTVVATHLGQIIQAQASELLGQPETEALIEQLRRQAPKLAEDLVPKLLPTATIQRVLQRLLEEGVPIRDIRTIAETLAAQAPTTQDVEVLTEAVRRKLGSFIVQRLYESAPELQVATLEPRLEQLLRSNMNAVEGGGEAALEPGLAERMLSQASHVMNELESRGLPAVILTSGALRPLLARFLRRTAERMRVLSYEEIPDNKTIRVVTTLGAE